jgi:hypothetical protein
MASSSDREFVAELRAVVDRYLSAVDEWESAHQKYYRLPGYESRIADDLIQEQHAYEQRRRELEAVLPRARRLCFKHGLAEPFSGLLRIGLGRYAPQQRMDSSIGRGERSVVAKCLVELADASQEWSPDKPESGPEGSRKGLLRRLVSYFY